MGRSWWSGQSVIEGRMTFLSLAGMLPESAFGWQVTHVGLLCGEGLPFSPAHFRRALPRAQSLGLQWQAWELPDSLVPKPSPTPSAQGSCVNKCSTEKGERTKGLTWPAKHPSPASQAPTQGLHLTGPEVTLSVSSVPPKINTRGDSGPPQTELAASALTRTGLQSGPPLSVQQSSDHWPLCPTPRTIPDSPEICARPGSVLGHCTHSISFNPQRYLHLQLAS